MMLLPVLLLLPLLQDPSVTVFRGPAGPGSGNSRLTVAEDGIYLSWLEKRDETSLKLAKWDGKAWSETRTIVSGKDLITNWADFPTMLARKNGSLVAHWLKKNGPRWFDYEIRIARSTDGGKSWTEALKPHRDRSEATHGFVSMVDQGKKGFISVWIDGRDMRGKDPVRKLMAARSTRDGFREEEVLDDRICECCWTAATRTRKGLFVAYRDRSESEVRDISCVRLVNGKWTKPKRIFADGWKIAG